MIDLTPAANALIALAAAMLTAFVIPWLRTRTSAQDREEMLKWVEIAVSAAQQLYHQLDGEHRKQYVLNCLSAKGYDINDVDVENAIEAAVLQLHQNLKGEEK